MQQADHTFIIPAFGNSDFLEACILSLKQQTIPGKILITTSTPSVFLTEIAEKYQLEIIVNESKTGLASDWSFAYKACTSKYLTLAHQDDLYNTNYAETFIKEAEKHGNIDCLILLSDYNELKINSLRNRSVVIFIKKILLLPFLFNNSLRKRISKNLLLVFGNPVACPSVMFNVENIGSFEFNSEYLYNVDWEAWIRLAKRKGSFVYIKKKMMGHRLHRESQTSIQIESTIRQKEEEKILKSIWGKWVGGILFFFYGFGGKFN